MEDYKLTAATIGLYKDKACEIVEGNCDKCEAMYKCNDGQWCCFDTVIRFAEYANLKQFF